GNYTTIQEAIDAANPGDTIYIHNGTYYEHVAVSKPLSLIGEDRDNTVIDAGGTGDVVSVTANHVNITSLTIVLGYGLDDAGILLSYVENCSITNTNLSDNWNGVLLVGSNGNVIANNIAGANGRGVHLIDSSDNVIVGNTASDNWDYGIFLVSSSNNTIAGNNISLGDRGIYLIVDSDGNEIRNNTVSSSGYGIHLRNSNGVAIANNNISDGWADGVCVESSSNVTVMRNNLTSNWNGVRLYSSDDVTVTQNNVSNSTWYGIYLYMSTNSTVTGNLMTKDGAFIRGDLVEHWNTHVIDTSNTVNGRPVYYWKNATGGVVPLSAGQVILANCTRVTVENQNISRTSVGILLGFSSENTIANNTAPSNKRMGINLQHSVGNTVVNNSSPGNEYGIYIDSSSRNIVSRNNASANNQYGIILDNSDDNLVVDGIISSNAVIGIRLYYADNNTVDNNTVRNNQYGITLYFSDNNTVADNNVSRSGQLGIQLGSSSGNGIYHNNFLNNTEQAEDDGAANVWDDGYPSGGNHWSDYAGFDNKSGPNQDQPGSDGIGDTPYPIQVGNEDRYPLMSPSGTIRHRPPKITSTTLSGKDMENITLTWSLSPDDGTGLGSVTGYAVYRNPTYDSSGLSYQFIAFLPNGTSAFVDSFTGNGDPSGYFYRVCALDANNSTACDNAQAGKFTRPLVQGPNLLSLPLIQSNGSMERLLQTVKYDKAWTYDSSSGEWKWYMTLKNYRRGPPSVNHTMGLWVNVTGDCNLTVAGIVPAQTTIHLRSGWNLVSFPSFNSSYTVANLKAELPVERVEGFDLTAPPHFLRVLQDSDVLLAGEGYWVKVSADATWVVSNV
ncbi:MAG: right-handed parallel beta-helix repeat-containing protein, partial [Thermoplasmata archaeon]|nr:right-handed parallel beta-helix repeat-containing protein [Thermoplasmata archaeon]